MKFRCLVVDPPWRFSDHLPGKGRGAAKHYATLSVEEIKRFPLPEMESDALLLLWSVASMQQEALDVCKAWGFVLKSQICWIKTTQPVETAFLGPSAKQEEWMRFTLAFGMGHYTRASHEVCLLATRGRFKVKAKNVRSVFFAPRGQHSEKPEAIFQIAEELSDGPYAEIFARRERVGWHQVGNEIGKLVAR